MENTSQTAMNTPTNLRAHTAAAADSARSAAEGAKTFAGNGADHAQALLAPAPLFPSTPASIRDGRRILPYAVKRREDLTSPVSVLGEKEWKIIMEQLTIRKAIWIGLAWVNAPVFPIMFGIPCLVMWQMGETDKALELQQFLFFVLLVIVTSFCAAWAWWAVMVPKWRLWAYNRVDDIPELKRQAVGAGLTWPDGHIFSKTEIKSEEHKRKENELEASGSQRD
mgnify:CR=1 FL=1